MFADQGKRPLLRPKRGAFFYAYFWTFGVTSIGSEDRDIMVDPQGVIAPMTGSDHPPIQIDDPHELLTVEGGDGNSVSTTRKRGDDTQALFTFGCGCRAVLRSFSSARSAPSSSSSS